MKRDLFAFLETYSSDPFAIDRLVISSFLYSNNLQFNTNSLLSRYVITSKDKDHVFLQQFLAIYQVRDIEELIKVFEFVVSPEDKVVTGAVYTPDYIRHYIVQQCFSNVTDLSNVIVCDPACGCSGFLFTAARAIKEKTGKPYAKIFEQNIYGLDIQKYSITRSKLLLTLFALQEGEDTGNISFNLFHGNALDFNWSRYIENFAGFDVIIGNPPYVCSRNMDTETLRLLENLTVTQSGHPDLYIPFFQIGYENLSKDGVLGVITVNTFIKSINGRALRNYLAEHRAALTIINFGGEQIFKDKSTYTCLCFLHKATGSILYKRASSSLLKKLQPASFFPYSYEELNHHDGWNLVDSADKRNFINKVEATGVPFKDLYVTRNGIATLKNDVYKFTPEYEDRRFYYITREGKEYQIEKSICRAIVNANKIKTERDLVEKEEQIIFPYKQSDGAVSIISEPVFLKRYPFAYNYLKSQRRALNSRDKGNVKDYEAWYAYGRRQSMDISAYKLFFPHICERPSFVISKDKDLLFYNGVAVISNSLGELEVLKSLLESDLFFDYIKNTTKDYSSGYISMSRNYLKNFGIPLITREEKRLLRSGEIDSNLFWEDIYERTYQANANNQVQVVDTMESLV